MPCAPDRIFLRAMPPLHGLGQAAGASESSNPSHFLHNALSLSLSLSLSLKRESASIPTRTQPPPRLLAHARAAAEQQAA